MSDRLDPPTLHDYHDGRLSREEEERVRRAIAADPRGQADLARLERLSALLRTVEAPPLATDFADRVLERIARLDREPRDLRALRPPRGADRAWTSAAAVLISVAATFLLVVFLFRTRSADDAHDTLHEVAQVEEPRPAAKGAERGRDREAPRAAFAEGPSDGASGFAQEARELEKEAMELGRSATPPQEVRARGGSAGRPQAGGERSEEAKGRFDDPRGLASDEGPAGTREAQRPAGDLQVLQAEARRKVAGLDADEARDRAEGEQPENLERWRLAVDDQRIAEFDRLLRAAGFARLPRSSFGRFAGGGVGRLYVTTVGEPQDAASLWERLLVDARSSAGPEGPATQTGTAGGGAGQEVQSEPSEGRGLRDRQRSASPPARPPIDGGAFRAERTRVRVLLVVEPSRTTGR